VSPEEDHPNKGVLAAEGIRGIAVMYQNYMNKSDGHGVIRLEPPETVSSPALKVYTYIQVTGQIICRHIANDDLMVTPVKKKETAYAKSKASVASQKALETTSVAKAMSVDADEGAEDDANVATEEESDGDNAAAKELVVLDNLANSGKKVKQPKAKGRPRGKPLATPKKVGDAGSASKRIRTT
jgi:hypothetical protein